MRAVEGPVSFCCPRSPLTQANLAACRGVSMSSSSPSQLHNLDNVDGTYLIIRGLEEKILGLQVSMTNVVLVVNVLNRPANKRRGMVSSQQRRAGSLQHAMTSSESNLHVKDNTQPFSMWNTLQRMQTCTSFCRLICFSCRNLLAAVPLWKYPIDFEVKHKHCTHQPCSCESKTSTSDWGDTAFILDAVVCAAPEYLVHDVRRVLLAIVSFLRRCLSYDSVKEFAPRAQLRNLNNHRRTIDTLGCAQCAASGRSSYHHGQSKERITTRLDGAHVHADDMSGVGVPDSLLRVSLDAVTVRPC